MSLNELLLPNPKEWCRLNVKSISLDNSGGSITPLDFYEKFSMTSTFSGPITTTSALTIRITRIGNMVYLDLPSAVAGNLIADVALVNDTAIPARFRPLSDHRYPCVIIQATVRSTGTVKVQTTGIVKFAPSTQETFSGAPAAGLTGAPDPITICYPVN